MSYEWSMDGSEPQPRLWPLKFEPDLEEIFQTQTISRNKKHVSTSVIIGVACYDLFIISDYFAAYNYIDWFFVGRFLIATPICFIIVYIIWNFPKLYDYLAIGCSFVMTSILSALIVVTEGDFRSDYLFGNILLMHCGGVMGRPRTATFLPVIILQSITYLLALQSISDIQESTKIVSTLYCLSGAVCAFLSAYGLERFSRRSFLLELRVSRLNQHLEHQSLTDPLTHLANRRAFEQATTGHWCDPCVRSQPVSIVLIDIDRFKLFNDTYGHSAGDLCLKRVAQSIKSAMPVGQSLAVRFGGEEVVLFLPNMNFAQARMLAEKVRLSILQEAIPHPIDTIDGVVSASFGVATVTADQCDAAELVIRADSALYAAKNNGRNQVWPSLKVETADR